MGLCRKWDGCIASDWTSQSVPEDRAGSLLGTAGRFRATAGACFDQAERVAPCPRSSRKLSPIFEGEFGFELLHALPFLHWLHRCGMLAESSACQGMGPFYTTFSPRHSERTCGTRPPRSRWLTGSMPRGTPDGWSWAGHHSLQFYAYPSRRWLPPPLHRRYRPLALPRLHSPREEPSRRVHNRDAPAPVRRVWLQNKYYPEGHGTADNFWSLDEVKLILDRLLGCGVEVIYNHPEVGLLGAADANDLGKPSARFRLGDLAMIRTRYVAQLASRSLILLPEIARSNWGGGNLSYNEVQLRVVSKSRCFMAPQGGASYLTFYQPGFHVVNDRTGKERCLSAQLASNGADGTYWHYYTRLPANAGESIIYNTASNRTRIQAALDAMCGPSLCAEPAGLIA